MRVEKHTHTRVQAQHAHACVLELQGHYKAAAHMLQQALSSCASASSYDGYVGHVFLAEILESLARVNVAVGAHDAAEKQLRRAYDVYVATSGKDSCGHLACGRVMGSLGKVRCVYVCRGVVVRARMIPTFARSFPCFCRKAVCK